jgi:FKBP-type peptidyl-prolyl cis-trans isomerase
MWTLDKTYKTRGQSPAKGDTVYVHYTGRLLDGTKFDSSVDRGTPFDFVLGEGGVIKCWDQGFEQMRVGEKAILTCPSDYAYGARGMPPSIPAYATLQFEVELLGIEQPYVDPNMWSLRKTKETRGQSPRPGQQVYVHYTGRLMDGTKFDSSVDRGTPFDFTLGEGGVIKCWDQGFEQMRVGEKAILTCPSDYAYGARGSPSGSIPPYATI